MLTSTLAARQISLKTVKLKFKTVMTKQNRLKCRDQPEAAEYSRIHTLLIKEQARVIHEKAVDEAKVQQGQKQRQRQKQHQNLKS